MNTTTQSTKELSRFWSIIEHRLETNTITDLHRETVRLLEADLRCVSFKEGQMLQVLAFTPIVLKLRAQSDAILDRIMSIIEDDEHDEYTMDRIKAVAAEYKLFAQYHAA